jgi:hypothetical protein
MCSASDGGARLVGALLWVIAALAAPSAHALVGDTEGIGGLDGSIRTLAAGVRNYDFPPFFGGEWDELSQTLLRLTLVGRPRPWVAYEVHGVESVDYASATGAPGTTPFGLAPRDVRYRALDASTTWHEDAGTSATLFLDRANVRLVYGRAEVTAGRQAITFGKTLFWNPLDVFLAFDPRQFDRDYKPGVDAVRVDVALGDFSGVDVVAAAGRTLDALGMFAGGDETLDATWFGSAVLGRAFATTHGWDVSLQGGKIYGGYQVGGGAVGELGPLEVRLEAAQLFADQSPPLLPPLFPGQDLVESGLQAVVGVGHRFESSLTLEAEYFENGLGDSAELDASLLRFVSGGILDLSDRLLGAVVSYDVLPILVGQLGTIVALDDPSVQVQPRLTWSAADEVEVLAGAIVSRGARPAQPFPGLFALRSEFGTFPDFYYVEVKLYF